MKVGITTAIATIRTACTHEVGLVRAEPDAPIVRVRA